MPQLDRRLAEAPRLGFRRAVIPKGVRPAARVDGLDVVAGEQRASTRSDEALIPAG